MLNVSKNFLFPLMTAAFGILLPLLSGCLNQNPERIMVTAAIPPNLAEEGVLAQRAEAFRKILKDVPVRGVCVFPDAFEHIVSNEEVISRVKNLGFNRIYCGITSESELDDNFLNFVCCAAKAEIPVEILLLQSDYYRTYHTNRLLRPLIEPMQYPDLPEMVGKVVKFNDSLPDEAKLAGITVVAMPHLYDGTNVERSYRQIFSWSKYRYGIGGDNDMLMKDAFELLKQIGTLAGRLPYTVGGADFYHEKAAEGVLSLGKITDFEKLAPRVVIINSGNVPSEIARNMEHELAAAKGKKNILVGIPLAMHVSVEEKRMRRRDWNDFVRVLDYAVKRYQNYPSFGGIVISPLAVIEFLRMEE